MKTYIPVVAFVIVPALIGTQSARAQLEDLAIVENADQTIGLDIDLPAGAVQTVGGGTSEQAEMMTFTQPLRETRKLTLAPLFVQLDAALRITNNAFSSPNNKESDVFLDSTLRFGYESKLPEHDDFTFNAFAYLGVTRYADFDQLDSNIVGGNISIAWSKALAATAGRRVTVFKLIAGYSPGILYSDDFDMRFVTSHPLSITTQIAIPLCGDDSQWTLLLSLRGARVFADPDEFEYWEALGAAVLAWTDDSGTLSIQGGLKARYRAYDDYFESMFGDSREDTTLNPSIALKWQIHPNVALVGGVDFIDNSSSLDAKEYDAVVGQIGLSIKF